MAKRKTFKPMFKMVPNVKSRPPRVIVEVSGGVAEVTKQVRGVGAPQVYILDHDNLKDAAPGDFAEPPKWALALLRSGWERTDWCPVSMERLLEVLEATAIRRDGTLVLATPEPVSVDEAARRTIAAMDRADAGRPYVPIIPPPLPGIAG